MNGNRTAVMRMLGEENPDTVSLCLLRFEPTVASSLEELKPPTEGELKVLREEIDPDRVVIGRVEWRLLVHSW